jgi:hypothetical protein
MSLLDYLKWLQYTPLLSGMRSSTWIFPIIASLHLMGLALLGGAVLFLDLHLLGYGLRQQSLAQVARDSERWLVISLAILLPTGIFQFLCFAATKYYYLTAFWVKMAALLLALLFTYAMHRRFAMADGAGLRSSMQRKAAAIVSLALWATVAVSGRLIGFP